jgi:hypothetical protein
VGGSIPSRLRDAQRGESAFSVTRRRRTTKHTKATKITKTNLPFVLFVIFVTFREITVVVTVSLLI